MSPIALVALSYAKSILSGIAGVILAIIGPGLIYALRGISAEKATGLAAVAGGLSGALFSPLFWILAVFLTLSFWSASRLHNRALRVFLFWIPTLFISTIGMAIVTLMGYVYLRSPRS